MTTTRTVLRQDQCYISSSEPAQRETIKLSPMDDLAPAIPFHFQFVYKNEKHDPDFMNPERLKQSLAKLISEYPVIAGKARIEDRKWYIETCETDSVPFIVATSELSLSDFDSTDY